MCVGGWYSRKQAVQRPWEQRAERRGVQLESRVRTGWKSRQDLTPQGLEATGKDSGPRTIRDSLWKDFKWSECHFEGATLEESGVFLEDLLGSQCSGLGVRMVGWLGTGWWGGEVQETTLADPVKGAEVDGVSEMISSLQVGEWGRGSLDKEHK